MLLRLWVLLFVIHHKKSKRVKLANVLAYAGTGIADFVRTGSIFYYSAQEVLVIAVLLLTYGNYLGDAS